MVTHRKMATEKTTTTINGKINHDETSASVILQNRIKSFMICSFFFGLFLVCCLPCIYVCAVISNRVPFHFLENVTDANSFIMRFYRAICYTNPFCLLSFSCSDIFTDTKYCVHTIYWVTYLKYTFNTEHEYGIPIPIQCIHTYIHRLVAYKRPQNYSRKRKRNLRLNPCMYVAYLAYSCRRYADQRNR